VCVGFVVCVGRRQGRYRSFGLLVVLGQDALLPRVQIAVDVVDGLLLLPLLELLGLLQLQQVDVLQLVLLCKNGGGGGGEA
jgi:hypothetical protein